MNARQGMHPRLDGRWTISGVAGAMKGQARGHPLFTRIVCEKGGKEGLTSTGENTLHTYGEGEKVRDSRVLRSKGPGHRDGSIGGVRRSQMRLRTLAVGIARARTVKKKKKERKQDDGRRVCSAAARRSDADLSRSRLP